MKKLALIKAGTTFSTTAQQYGDFEDWTRHGLGLEEADICVVDVVQGDPLPPVASCRGVVITGAHCMVTDNQPWSLAIERWLPELLQEGVPFLGICYGHQLLARAMGGKVGFHPNGKELGTVDICLRPESAGDALLGKLPKHFPAHVTHAQTVLTLPPGAVCLAENNFEANHAFRLGAQAWGVQFHPEYDTRIMHAYLTEQAASIEASGQTLAELQNQVRKTPEAAAMLKTFARICNNTII